MSTEYIRSIKQLETFDSTKDARRKIELKKVTDDISKIPTSVHWNEIVLKNILFKKLPDNLSCEFLEIENNNLITTLTTDATRIVVRNCYMLKKIVAPNCTLLTIDGAISAVNIPNNNYGLLSILAKNKHAAFIPKNVVFDRVTLHNVIVKSDIYATDIIHLNKCMLDKKNMVIKADEYLFIDSTTSTYPIKVATDSLSVTNFNGVISDKSSFKNIRSYSNTDRSVFTYDFMKNKTIEKCEIGNNGPAAFPNNVTILKEIKVAGLTQPKSIDIKEYAYVTLDKNWTTIPNYKRGTAFSYLDISTECANNIKSVLSLSAVSLTHHDKDLTSIKLKDLVCERLSIHNDNDELLSVEIPEQHIILESGSYIHNKSRVFVYYTVDKQKIDVNLNLFKNINWGDVQLRSVYDLDCPCEMTFEGEPIRSLKGFCFIDNIPMLYSFKKITHNRTYYTKPLKKLNNNRYGPISCVAVETLTDGNTICSHGVNHKYMLESLEYKKESFYRYDKGNIKSKYNAIPRDMPIDKDFCIKMYRELTGACEAGVNAFIKNTVKKPKDTYTINEIVEMTRGQYGYERFVNALK